MSAGVRIEIDGVGATLRALRSIDPELRKRVPEEVKGPAQPMLAELKASYPDEMLSGWSRKGRTGYRPGSARWKSTLQFRGARPRNSPVDSWPVLRLRSKHLAAIIADTAAKGRTPSGRAFVRKLREEYGRTSRFVWPVVEKHSRTIERSIADTFARYEKIVNDELARRR